MTYYRIYLLGPDKSIFDVKEHYCDDDTAAMESATQYSKTHDIEIWQTSRKVGELPRGSGKSPSA